MHRLPERPWPHDLPCRLRPPAPDGLLCAQLGPVAPGLAEGRYDPVQDRVVLYDGTRLEHYFAAYLRDAGAGRLAPAFPPADADAIAAAGPGEAEDLILAAFPRQGLCAWPPPIALREPPPPAAARRLRRLAALTGRGLRWPGEPALAPLPVRPLDLFHRRAAEGPPAFVLLAAAVKVLHPLAAQALSFLPAPIALGLGLSLALALTILAAWFLFPVTMILFLQPVLDPLSRRAEARVLGWEPPAGGRGFVRDLADSLHTAARILLLQVLGLGLTLALTPVGLGPLAGLALSSWLAGFGWFDYPLARRGLSYGAKASWVRRNWAAAAGLGLAFQLSLLIPFFNLFLSAPAAAVAAGTLYFRLPPPAPPPGPAGARAVG